MTKMVKWTAALVCFAAALAASAALLGARDCPSDPTGNYTYVDWIENATFYTDVDLGLSAPNGFDFSGTIVVTAFGPQAGMDIIGSHDLADPYYRNFLGMAWTKKWQLGHSNTFDGRSYVSVNVKYLIDGSTVNGRAHLTVNSNAQASDSVTRILSDGNLYLFRHQYNQYHSYASSRFRLYRSVLTVSGGEYTIQPAIDRDGRPCAYIVEIDRACYPTHGSLLFGND